MTSEAKPSSIVHLQIETVKIKSIEFLDCKLNHSNMAHESMTF